MAKRRGKGEGSIYQRKRDGKWVGRVEVRAGDGKRHRKTFTRSTKKEVAEEIRKHLHKQETGTEIDCGRLTVADFLRTWLASTKSRNAPGTYAEYKRVCDSYLIPAFSTIKLSAIRPLHIQALLTNLQDGGIGDRTRQYCYATLHRAFQVGIRLQQLAVNPCKGVDVPKVTRREVVPLSEKQITALMKAAEGNRFQAMIVLALTTGMRQGELFALHWESIDFKRRTVQVCRSLEETGGQLRLKEPKSKAGRRLINLPEEAVDALRAQQRRQMAAGLAGCDLVFPNTEGGLLRKASFLRQGWDPIRTAAGLKKFHFHDLRHTYASLMIGAGTNTKYLQTRMGHSTFGMTMDTYGHLMREDLPPEAAATFARVLKKKPG